MSNPMIEEFLGDEHEPGTPVEPENQLIIRVELPGWKGMTLAALGVAFRGLGEGIEQVIEDKDEGYDEKIDVGYYMGAQVTGDEIEGTIVMDIHAIGADKRYAEELGMIAEDDET